MLKLTNYQVVLGSASPRRRQLLEGLGITFKVKKISAKEEIPEGVSEEKAAEHLAEYKGDILIKRLDPSSLLITADTVVLNEGAILGKPTNKREAKEMIRSLGGKEHLVITGVCIQDRKKKAVFSDLTSVLVDEVTEEEADYYVDNYQVLDKAGAYGIQDWFGKTKVLKIDGSFYNVMGLPVHRVYSVLKNWR